MGLLAGRPATAPPGWPRWLRLWHFAAGILLSLGVAAAALVCDPPRWLAVALTDGEAVVSAIGATGLPTPAQLAWQLLTSSMPFFDVALRLALDNIATTATATAATAATAASAAAQASVTAKGGGAAPRLQL